jgi:predicted RNA polymerase sigma factor
MASEDCRRSTEPMRTREIAEGVRVLRSAPAVRTEERRPGRHQVEAAIAALPDDAASAEETDWRAGVGRAEPG